MRYRGLLSFKYSFVQTHRKIALLFTVQFDTLVIYELSENTKPICIAKLNKISILFYSDVKKLKYYLTNAII